MKSENCYSWRTLLSIAQAGFDNIELSQYIHYYLP